jgi:uncharacterized protein
MASLRVNLWLNLWLNYRAIYGNEPMLTVKAASIALLTLVAVVNLAAPVNAIAPQDVRLTDTWVQDQADILSPTTEMQLNDMIGQLESKNGSEIAIVTVPDTQPSATPKAFATELFNRWKIGKAGVNNGVLFLVSKNQRRVEIEVGSGLNTILPTMKIGSILTRDVTPAFKQGNFDAGTIAGTQAIVEVLQTQTFAKSGDRSMAQAETGIFDSAQGILALVASGFVVIGGFIGLCWFLATRPMKPKIRTQNRYIPSSSTPSSSSDSRCWNDHSNTYSDTSWNSSSDSFNDSSSDLSSDSSSSSWSSSDSSSSSSSSDSSSSSSSSSDWGGGSSDGGGGGSDW